MNLQCSTKLISLQIFQTLILLEFYHLQYNIYITNIFILSINHITEVVELADWILDVHWLRNSDQSVGVLSTKVYLLISHTLAS